MPTIPPHIEALLRNAKRIYCDTPVEALTVAAYLDEQMRCVCDYPKMREGFTPFGQSVVDQLLGHGPGTPVLPVFASTDDPYLRNADVKIFGGGEFYVNFVACVSREQIEEALEVVHPQALILSGCYEVYLNQKLRQELAAC